VLVDSSQPHTDELVGYIFDLFETDNLPVEFAALRSGLASNDDHERHTGLARQGLAGVQREEPAVLAGLLLTPGTGPPSLGHRERRNCD
jgi:hypothetical protein